MIDCPRCCRAYPLSGWSRIREAYDDVTKAWRPSRRCKHCGAIRVFVSKEAAQARILTAI